MRGGIGPGARADPTLRPGSPCEGDLLQASQPRGTDPPDSSSVVRTREARRRAWDTGARKAVHAGVGRAVVSIGTSLLYSRD